MIKPPHPGETIKEDYIVPLRTRVNRPAAALGIGAARLNEIAPGVLLRNQRRILAESRVSLRPAYNRTQTRARTTPLNRCR